MPKPILNYSVLTIAAIALSGCGVAKTTGKVVSAPFKGAYKVAETTGKVAYGGGKLAYGTARFTGKGVYMVGKGAYYVGNVPITITDAALDTSARVLRITTEMVDLSGKVVSVYRDVQAVQLENELMKYKGAKNVVRVFVDAIA